MIKKELKKLVGLKKSEFDEFVTLGNIKVQPARLIPVLKTGDEMALTSIFLSAVKLVKEFRDGLFKDIKLSRAGKVFYYTEASFPDISNCRVDGLIIVVVKGVIIDASFFEMKNKNNSLDQAQIESYLDISKQLKVPKLITVSNELVPDPTISPVNVKVPKNVSLLHFSWTYFITKGQLLLFNNDFNIEDEDQVEIMREVLYYFNNTSSGISRFTQMNSGWKELVESVKGRKPLKLGDQFITDAILSWYEEEKDMALLLSRHLGVLVKSSVKKKESLKDDIKKVIKDNKLNGVLSIKGAVSDLKIKLDLESSVVSMSNKIIPPLNKGLVGRVSAFAKQLENCKKKNPELFEKIQKSIWIEADVKFAKENLKVKVAELGELSEIAKGKEIQAFHIVYMNDFKASFSSNKKFIVTIEEMLLDYYEVLVQHLKNWEKPSPRIEIGEV
jgi:hypothetical protein